jgi:ribosomal protein S7
MKETSMKNAKPMFELRSVTVTGLPYTVCVRLTLAAAMATRNALGKTEKARTRIVRVEDVTQ